MKRLLIGAAIAALSLVCLTGCNRPEVEQYAKARYDACMAQYARQNVTGPIADAACHAEAARETQQKYGTSVAP